MKKTQIEFLENKNIISEMETTVDGLNNISRTKKGR